MTPEAIRQDIISRFNRDGFRKYNEGQDEHGGLITDRTLSDEMWAEAIDLIFYVGAQRQKKGEIAYKVDKILREDGTDSVARKKVWNLIQSL